MHQLRSFSLGSLTAANKCSHYRFMRLGLLVALVLTGCSKPNPVVCCSSPADCNSIGASGQTRPCDDGFVCVDHECANAPPIDAAPMCSVDSDCPVASPHCTNNTCVQCVTSDQCAAAMPICD